MAVQSGDLPSLLMAIFIFWNNILLLKQKENVSVVCLSVKVSEEDSSIVVKNITLCTEALIVISLIYCKCPKISALHGILVLPESCFFFYMY